MENFIDVKAENCNVQGITDQKQPKVDLKLNIDLIGAIQGNVVLLKGGKILNLGDKYFTNFMYVKKEVKVNR
mgnify:CR=1 FL=1